MGWTIAVQRKVSNATHDILCFHPKFGIIIWEVKDWDPGARSLRISGNRIMAKNIGTDNEYPTDDPIGQVNHYRKILAELFPRFTDAEVLITTVVAMTNFNDEDATTLLSPLMTSASKKREYAPYSIVAGKETLEKNVSDWIVVVNRKENVFLENYRRNLELSSKVAIHMSWLLRVPELEVEKYEPLQLVKQKIDFLSNPNGTKRRKVKGAVGSGKSTLLAARAADAVTDNKSVLIISFTITLRHWIHGLIVRAGLRNPQNNQKEFSKNTKELVSFWYLHEFARELAVSVGRGTEFRKLFADSVAYPRTKSSNSLSPQ